MHPIQLTPKRPLLHQSHLTRFGAPRPLSAQAQWRQAAEGLLVDSAKTTAEKMAAMDALFAQGWDLKHPDNKQLILSAVSAVGMKDSEPAIVDYLIGKGLYLYAQGHLNWNAAHQVVNMPFPPYGLLTSLLKADQQQEKRLANMPDKKGFTPVHVAARKGYLGALQRFVQFQADFTLKTPRNQDVHSLVLLSKKRPAIDYVLQTIPRNPSPPASI